MKLWEADREYGEFLRGIVKNLPEPVHRQFLQSREAVGYYDRGSYFESQLKSGFNGNIPEKEVGEFLQRLEYFKSLRPILTAPIANPYKPELYKKAA